MAAAARTKAQRAKGAAKPRPTAKPAAKPRPSAKRAASAALVTGAAAERQLRTFLAKFEPRVRKTITACRAALRRRLPTAHELVWDNYNFFVIGWSPTGKPYDSPFSLAAAANGVGLSFLQGASMPDPEGILEGAGKQNRFVRLASAADLARPEVAALIDAAIARTKVPFAASGAGTLTVRSISAKQRARRR